MSVTQREWSSSKPYLRPLLLAYYSLLTCILAAVMCLRVSAIRRQRSGAAAKTISVARVALLLLFIDSFLLSFGSLVLVFGVDLAETAAACSTASYFCIITYAASKLSIYVFLMEKMYLTHLGKVSTKRFKDRFMSKWYCGAVVLLLGWMSLLSVILPGRHATISNGECHIGIHLSGSVPAIVLDTVLSAYLTAGFLYSLYNTGHLQLPGSRRMAKDCFVASIICLISSNANLAVLTVSNGHQRAYVCLAACMTDIAICALAFYFTTLRIYSPGTEDLDLSKVVTSTIGTAGLSLSLLPIGDTPRWGSGSPRRPAVPLPIYVGVDVAENDSETASQLAR